MPRDAAGHRRLGLPLTNCDAEPGVRDAFPKLDGHDRAGNRAARASGRRRAGRAGRGGVDGAVARREPGHHEPRAGVRRPVVRRRRGVRDSARHGHGRGGSRGRAQRRHRRSRQGAAQRRGAGRVHLRGRHPQAGGHHEGQRHAGLRGQQPRPQHRLRLLPRGRPRLRGRERRQRLSHEPGLHLRVERLAARRAGQRQPAARAGRPAAGDGRRADDHRPLDGGVAEPGQRHVRAADVSRGDARRVAGHADAPPAPERSAPDGAGRPVALRGRHDRRVHAAGRHRRRDDLRVRVRGAGPDRDGPRVRRRPRLRLVRAAQPGGRPGHAEPALRGRRAGARARGGRRIVAERPDDPGLRLPGIQRGRGRPAGVGRGDPVRRRRTPDVRQRALRPDRPLHTPARGPQLSDGRVPVHLGDDHGSADRPDRRPAGRVHGFRHLSERHPGRRRLRVLRRPRVAHRDAHDRRADRAAAQRALLDAGPGAPAGRRRLPRPGQSDLALAVLPGGLRRDGQVGARRRAAAGDGRPVAGRRHGRHRCAAGKAVSDDSRPPVQRRDQRAGRARLLRLAAAGERQEVSAVRARARQRRQRRGRRHDARGGGAARHHGQGRARARLRRGRPVRRERLDDSVPEDEGRADGEGRLAPLA